jgi:phosphate uptake regulator
MRRKIIKQGNNSYTLTLPIDWIRDEKLNEGSEVEINRDDADLRIHLPSDVKRIENAIEFDLRDFSQNTVKNILNQLYRKGYDKIILKYKKSQINSIKNTTRELLLGFELTENDGSTCIIQNIAEPSVEKFDVIFRKIFFIIKEESSEILRSLKEGSLDLKQREIERNLLDQYNNLCRRLIVRDRIGGFESYSIYLVLSKLVLISHSYFNMYKSFIDLKLKPREEILEILNESNVLFSLFYESYYKKDLEMADKIKTLSDKLIDEKIYNLFLNPKRDGIILYYLGEIIRNIQLASVNVYSKSINP